jgi:hypothetical protein
MSDKFWSVLTLPDCAPVPANYRGVWMRTLLETPDLRDDTTFVRWLQLGRWHADLRVPATIPAAIRANGSALTLSECSQAQLALLATQQGFAGLTQVTRGELGEVCTWCRVVDYQPPRPTADAGVMVFESPECVSETGIHGVYREVWHRLPNSTERLIALAEPERPDGLASARIFIAGQYLMRVRPSQPTGPYFEISFGLVEAGRWHIHQTTIPELEGQSIVFSAIRSGRSKATVVMDYSSAGWDILEWDESK